MTLQLSVNVRNGRLDSLETTIGASPRLRIRTGAQPASCAAARTGTILATVVLPADWMANASSGSKAMSGTWEDDSADANGVAGHFEIMDATLTTCHLQGSVSGPGGGGDMILDNVNLAVGQRFTVTSFTLTDGNA